MFSLSGHGIWDGAVAGKGWVGTVCTGNSAGINMVRCFCTICFNYFVLLSVFYCHYLIDVEYDMRREFVIFRIIGNNLVCLLTEKGERLAKKTR